MFWQGLTADEVGVLHMYNDDPHYTKLYLDKIAPMNPIFPTALFQDIGTVASFQCAGPIVVISVDEIGQGAHRRSQLRQVHA